jgi:nickel-dependent lactate racemase
LISQAIGASGEVTPEQVREVVHSACPVENYRGRRVLLIIPDGTRTAPVGLMFKTLFARIGREVAALDVLVALGTHQPMSEAALCDRLELSVAERDGVYGKVRFFNHEWDNPAALRTVGTLSVDEVRELSGGRFEMEVPVEINRRVFDYDELIILGPVFPHEVVGFSGGNKYLFPGIGGPRILDFFHWLAGVITNPRIIGNKWTPVRKVVDRAGALVPLPKKCFAMVVTPDKRLAGLFSGTPEGAWDAASDLSDKVHILYKDRPFKTVLSVLPPMYDEVWVGGKGMYKLEPVVEDGGEVILYGPHIREISLTHGHHIRKLGYHCRDYFLKQWDRFKDFPWGVIAHCTHVRGIGTYEAGVERCRIQVTLATGIPEAECRAVNLGYRDPASISPEAFANRESEGILLVPKAGEMLYRLKTPPPWARSEG